jgi:hypothetical protein
MFTETFEVQPFALLGVLTPFVLREISYAVVGCYAIPATSLKVLLLL